MALRNINQTPKRKPGVVATVLKDIRNRLIPGILQARFHSSGSRTSSTAPIGRILSVFLFMTPSNQGLPQVGIQGNTLGVEAKTTLVKQEEECQNRQIFP